MFAILAVVSLAAIVGACGEEESGEAGGSAGAERVRVGFVLPSATDPFYREVGKGATEEAKRLGNVELNYVAPTGTLDVQKYINAVDDVASRGVRAMAMDPYDAKLFTPILERLVEQGIPVVNMGNPPVPGFGKEAAVVNTDTEGAVAAGMKSMAGAMGGKGSVGLLEFPGNIVVSRRIELAKDALEQAGIDVVASAPMDCSREKGANATQDMLQAHPEITGIFAGCGLPGVGAARAAQQAGKDIVIYSFDGGADELEAIKAGALTGAIRQRPRELGATTVGVLADLARGKQVKKEHLTGFDVVTQENVDQFLE